MVQTDGGKTEQSRKMQLHGLGAWQVRGSQEGVQGTKGNPIQHREHCNPLSRPESCLLQHELNDAAVA